MKLTEKQKQVLALIKRCGHVTIPYGAVVSGVDYSKGTTTNIKLAKNALLSLVRSGVVVSQTTELGFVKYLSSCDSCLGQ